MNSTNPQSPPPSLPHFHFPSFSFVHSNSVDLPAFLSASALAMGRNDISLPLSKLHAHWIENLADLRLLYSEGLLRELGLPMRLVLWIEEQITAVQLNSQPQSQSQIPSQSSMQAFTIPTQLPLLPLLVISPPSDSSHSAVEELAVETNEDLGVSFTYNNRDFGTDGIIYYLATGGLTRPWTNPMTSGLVMVRASSILSDSQPLSAVVGLQTVRCVTRSEANSWISIDFLGSTIIPSHYSVRHYSSWDNEALRSWRFEGSNDGKSWVTLREHLNDTSLQLKGQSQTWPVDANQIAIKNAGKGFRLFRIFQTGENSNNHHYLACSGFELFGTFYQGDPASASVLAQIVPSADAKPLVAGLNEMLFQYSSDLDGNGIVSYLSTAGRTAPFVNPVIAKQLAVTASSLASDSQPAFSIVGDSVVRCVTRAEPLSWFMIDFLHRAICPTAYTLRHYATWDNEALRSWHFLASNDGIDWTLLIDHVNDDSLEYRVLSNTWKFPPEHVQDRFFRYFKILQVDKNSNNHLYLALSGFELYGLVRVAAGNPMILTPQNGLLASQQLIRRPSSMAAVDPSVSLSVPFLPPVVDVPTWDSVICGQFLSVLPPSFTQVKNIGSSDKWQMVRSSASYSDGIQRVSVKIIVDPPTSNTWKFIIGCIPAAIDCRGAKQWVGTAGSWGYIAGTGGKCHEKANSINYGEKFGLNDVITIVLNFPNRTIEFLKNGISQGIAFDNLIGSVNIAASLTATDSQLAIGNFTDPNSAAPQLQQLIAPIPLSISQPLVAAWDPINHSPSLVVQDALIRNSGSNDKWQSARSLNTFSRNSTANGISEFTVEVTEAPKTPNTWQIIVGVVPNSFTCIGSKQWVGAGESWGYIGGTGGKCFNQPKSLVYGAPFGAKGDRITARLNFNNSSIEFLKNGVSQGVAFDNLSGSVHAAVSLTATGAVARLIVGPSGIQ